MLVKLFIKIVGNAVGYSESIMKQNESPGSFHKAVRDFLRTQSVSKGITIAMAFLLSLQGLLFG